jgi:hypothetical protein
MGRLYAGQERRPCPPSITILKASPRLAMLLVSSPTTGCWQRPRRSWQRRNASIRRRGRNNGSSPPSATRRTPGTSPAGHHQGGIYPPGGQSALRGHPVAAPHRGLLPVLAVAPPPTGHGTGYGSGQYLRLKLLKIGARTREISRRIWVHLASGYPYCDLLAGLLQNLRASPG